MRALITFALLAASAAAQQPIGEVQSAEASVRGAVTVGATGTIVMSGSQVTAGANPASIRFVRGGELRVCARGSVTITASSSGKEALVGLSSGAIETHYHLGTSADTIMTPDFRLLLSGPGDFHFAVGMKSSGGMCVKSLPGNTSAMIVNEVFGDGTHQVRPGDAVLFHQGSVQNADTLPPADDCGCAGTLAAKPKELGFPEQQSQRAAAAIAAGEPPPQPTLALPGVSSTKNEVITKVDAPIVFRGEDLPPPNARTPDSAATAPARAEKAAELNRESEPRAAASAVGGDQPPKPAKKRWYQRFGSALARLFHS